MSALCSRECCIFPFEEARIDIFKSALDRGLGRICSKGTSLPCRSCVTSGLFAGMQELVVLAAVVGNKMFSCPL